MPPVAATGTTTYGRPRVVGTVMSNTTLIVLVLLAALAVWGLPRLGDLADRQDERDGMPPPDDGTRANETRYWGGHGRPG